HSPHSFFTSGTGLLRSCLPCQSMSQPLLGKDSGGGAEFHIIVLQHTDCGITRLFPFLRMASQQNASSVPAATASRPRFEKHCPVITRGVRHRGTSFSP